MFLIVLGIIVFLLWHFLKKKPEQKFFTVHACKGVTVNGYTAVEGHTCDVFDGEKHRGTMSFGKALTIYGASKLVENWDFCENCTEATKNFRSSSRNGLFSIIYQIENGFIKDPQTYTIKGFLSMAECEARIAAMKKVLEPIGSSMISIFINSEGQQFNVSPVNGNGNHKKETKELVSSNPDAPNIDSEGRWILED